MDYFLLRQIILKALDWNRDMIWFVYYKCYLDLENSY